jgi:hypothetical protein
MHSTSLVRCAGGASQPAPPAVCHMHDAGRLLEVQAPALISSREPRRPTQVRRASTGLEAHGAKRGPKALMVKFVPKQTSATPAKPSAQRPGPPPRPLRRGRSAAQQRARLAWASSEAAARTARRRRGRATQGRRAHSLAGTPGALKDAKAVHLGCCLLHTSTLIPKQQTLTRPESESPAALQRRPPPAAPPLKIHLHA